MTAARAGLVLLLSLLPISICARAGEIGLYPVRTRLGAAFIDKTGKVVLQTPFDEATRFWGGLAGVKKGGKWGYIDRTGRLVIGFRNRGFIPYACLYDLVAFEEEDPSRRDFKTKSGFEHCDGKPAIAPRFDIVAGFFEGVAAVQEGKLWHYITPSGDRAFPEDYEYADSFIEGLAAVTQAGKMGFINRTGRLVIPLKFKEARSFSEGLAAVTMDGEKWGYIDHQGEMRIQPVFDGAMRFKEGLAAVKADFHWGYADRSGTVVIPATFWSAGSFVQGLAVVGMGKKHGYINRKGHYHIPLRFHSAGGFSEEGIARVALPIPNDPALDAHKDAYIDRSGRYIWGPN